MNSLIKNTLQQQLNEPSLHWQPLGGGNSSCTYQVTTTSGQQLFVKTDHSEAIIQAEIQNLQYMQQVLNLSKTIKLRTPEPVVSHKQFFACEFIHNQHPSNYNWQTAGRALAEFHCASANLNTEKKFGFYQNNYCGPGLQPNNWMTDGWHFFAENRLLFQARLALKNGLLNLSDVEQIEKLCIKLPQLIPQQPPVLLHGDLWRGNILFDENGMAVLIDPACYFGWSEAEIAMTQLFGGFPEAFYHGYTEINPLKPGWKNRLRLYNLFHLLNHLNLFGSSYYASIIKTVRAFI